MIVFCAFLSPMLGGKGSVLHNNEAVTIIPHVGYNTKCSVG